MLKLTLGKCLIVLTELQLLSHFPFTVTSGMSLVDGKCKFCPANQFSDGNSGCQKCPENTAPIYGLTYQWWQNLPMTANVSSECLAMSGE